MNQTFRQAAIAELCQETGCRLPPNISEFIYDFGGRQGTKSYINCNVDIEVQEFALVVDMGDYTPEFTDWEPLDRTEGIERVELFRVTEQHLPSLPGTKRKDIIDFVRDININRTRILHDTSL
eukprot:m.203948 g.203948  ORF g.203948 m.203948 type:complete len:123 (+) comp15768_c1_seq4:458-826(+)